MQTNIRKIGNSRGIIIPAHLLASCRITDKVELELRGESLVLHRTEEPRAGWFKNYQETPDERAEAKGWEAAEDSQGDWEW